jgi:hypothetical protein
MQLAATTKASEPVKPALPKTASLFDQPATAAIPAAAPHESEEDDEPFIENDEDDGPVDESEELL